MASKIFHLPDYCNTFKQFLVEELIFYESPFEFHHGKCLVIGKLSVRDNKHYLQNISLNCFDEEFRLKTGSVEILLLPTSYRSNPSDLSSFRHLVDGLFYEVHGETAFTPKQEPADLSALTVNTMEMVMKLRLKHLTFSDSVVDYEAKDMSMSLFPQFDEVQAEQDIKDFETNHIPAIQVHTINEVNKAEELIQTNLKLRLLRERRRRDNY